MQCLWDIDRWQMETQLHSFFLALIFQLYTQKLKVLIVAAQPKKKGFDCILFELWQLKGQRSQNTLHFGITKWVKHQLSWIILQCKIVFFVDQFTPCSVNWWHPSPDPCCHPNCLKKQPENELTWHENQKNYKDKWKKESMNMRKYGHFFVPRWHNTSCSVIYFMFKMFCDWHKHRLSLCTGTSSSADFGIREKFFAKLGGASLLHFDNRITKKIHFFKETTVPLWGSWMLTSNVLALSNIWCWNLVINILRNAKNMVF